MYSKVIDEMSEPQILAENRQAKRELKLIIQSGKLRITLKLERTNRRLKRNYFTKNQNPNYKNRKTGKRQDYQILRPHLLRAKNTKIKVVI